MKINGETTTAKEFAYDGCHKIYLLESADEREEARDCAYDILPISSLREAFNNSCGLQFISNWKLSKRYVEQFGEACFEA
jgi:hypothetical protein